MSFCISTSAFQVLHTRSAEEERPAPLLSPGLCEVHIDFIKEEPLLSIRRCHTIMMIGMLLIFIQITVQIPNVVTNFQASQIINVVADVLRYSSSTYHSSVNAVTTLLASTTLMTSSRFSD